MAYESTQIELLAQLAKAINLGQVAAPVGMDVGWMALLRKMTSASGSTAPVTLGWMALLHRMTKRAPQSPWLIYIEKISEETGPTVTR